MTMNTVLGVDIGGANLKYATVDGRCFERSFPMWTRWRDLSDQLAEDIARFPDTNALAVTMTGELADCFHSRRDGVAYIVKAVTTASSITNIQASAFYATDGRFYRAESCRQLWQQFAASNWHALANCVASKISSDALLVDVGSTTTDVVSIENGKVVTPARTDYQRLKDQSLVYIGCRRTPVCGLVSSLRLRDDDVAVMKELFATIDDARLWVSIQDEDSSDLETANGKPRTRVHAKARLARMLGLDQDELTDDETRDLATQIHRAARDAIASATSRWCKNDGIVARSLRDRESGTESRSDSVTIDSHPAQTWILSGHGQDLINVPDYVTVVDLRTRLPEGVSRAAPSWAVAVLAQENSLQP